MENDTEANVGIGYNNLFTGEDGRIWLVATESKRCPGYIIGACQNFLWSQAYCGYSNSGVRPLVRLKSDVKMTWNGTAWDLSI